MIVNASILRFLRFLFHIGSIKRLLLSRNRLAVLCFYSILVRLKVMFAGAYAVKVRKFLFHIGSIKSDKVGAYCGQ